jgi:hypothetical protein
MENGGKIHVKVIKNSVVLSDSSSLQYVIYFAFWHVEYEKLCGVEG